MSGASPSAQALLSPDPPQPRTTTARGWTGVPQDRTALLAVALLLLGLAVRVAYVLHTNNYVLRSDPLSYANLGAGLASGQGWNLPHSAYRPPGYPFFLAAVDLVFGIPHGRPTDQRLVEAVLATVTLGLIGLMARRLAGRRVMLIALAIGTVYVPLVLVGVAIMSESLLVPLVLAGTLCALRARTADRRWRWIVLSGLFAGLAALTRGNGVVAGLGFAVVVWTVKPRFSLRSLTAPALLLGVMVLTISPWTIRNAIAVHKFIPITDELGNTLAGTYNYTAARHHYIWVAGKPEPYTAIKKDPRLTEVTRSSKELSAAFTYIENHPDSVPKVVFWNTMRLFDLQGSFIAERSARTDVGATASFADAGMVSFWIVGLLALGGCFTLAARRIPRSFWAIPILIWASEAPITTGTPRFRAALEPFFILLAACAVEALAVAVARRRAGGVVPAAA